MGEIIVGAARNCAVLTAAASCAWGGQGHAGSPQGAERGRAATGEQPRRRRRLSSGRLRRGRGHWVLAAMGGLGRSRVKKKKKNKNKKMNKKEERKQRQRKGGLVALGFGEGQVEERPKNPQAPPAASQGPKIIKLRKIHTATLPHRPSFDWGSWFETPPTSATCRRAI